MTNAEAWFNKSLRPRKPEDSLGRTAQDVHLDSHTAPNYDFDASRFEWLIYTNQRLETTGVHMHDEQIKLKINSP